jgi:dolichol-phosphate mannosyltransferase
MNPIPTLQVPRLFSIIVPARDEEGCIVSTVEKLHLTLSARSIPHEIVVVDDGSRDQTWALITALSTRIPEIKPVQNSGPNGFGRAVIYGFDQSKGDAVVIFMADASDDAAEAVVYWEKLCEGWDCVFGSRFVKGGRTYDYPRTKLVMNRLFNYFIRFIFRISLNDTTNAFKAYRRHAIDGCRPLIAPHFNLTVELPLKSIVRGYSWTVVPITWRNRRTGEPKLKIKEMGSRYFFICMYVWLEKYFSRGDYRRHGRPLNT